MRQKDVAKDIYDKESLYIICNDQRLEQSKRTVETPVHEELELLSGCFWVYSAAGCMLLVFFLANVALFVFLLMCRDCESGFLQRILSFLRPLVRSYPWCITLGLLSIILRNTLWDLSPLKCEYALCDIWVSVVSVTYWIMEDINIVCAPKPTLPKMSLYDIDDTRKYPRVISSRWEPVCWSIMIGAKY